MIIEKEIVLAEKQIHIWSFDIESAESEMSACEALLNTSEKERASKFKFSEDSERFLWGRALLKQLLGVYVDENPRAVTLNYTSEGKPFLRKKGQKHIEFNISHSCNCIMIAFSRSPIGIDVEKVCSQVDIKRISRKYFSPEERKRIESSSEENRNENFFDIWTKKEALIKGIGIGLGIPLNNFCVMSDKSGCVKWKPENQFSSSEWYVGSVETLPSYKAAVATLIENVEVAFFPINEQILQKLKLKDLIPDIKLGLIKKASKNEL